MKYLFLCLALLIALSGLSQDTKHPIDVQNSACLNSSVPTTMGSINCEIAAVKAWKAEIDSILSLLQEKKDLLDVSLLLETQDKWQSFHESHIKFYYSFFQINYQGGTMARVAAVSYEKKHLRERAMYLKDFYEQLE